VASVGQKEYSEETARKIDGEIQALLEAAHGRVRETLAARRDVLEALDGLLAVPVHGPGRPPRQVAR
jgi:ATP-dependent Zn protease